MEETVRQSETYDDDVNTKMSTDANTDGLGDLLQWAYQYMEDNFVFTAVPGRVQTQDFSDNVAKTNMYASEDGTILTFQRSQCSTDLKNTDMTKESDITSAQTPKRDNSGRRGLETTEKLVHITAETGAILGEIQSYLLSQDIAENKCPTRTTAIECNASEDDTALISQKSQIMDIKESQTREGGSGSGWDDQDNNKKHTCLESLFRCLCDCGFPRPTKKEKPFTGNRKRGLFQRLGQLFKRN